jgi:predicted O-methyltransferase YrrM
MSHHDQWTAVDHYLLEKFFPADEALDAAQRAADAANLPTIQVAPTQGKLLYILAKLMGARRILEMGTLGGYSTIWLARALPADGRLITLELDPKHAEVAQGNLAHAGLADKVEIRQGKALESLAGLVAEGQAPFDLVFIDADKPNTPAYFEWALKLSRPGSLIITDNVVRDGQVANASSTDASVQGIRSLFDVMAAELRVTVTAIQTVGAKGYDGLAFALVKS